MSVIVWNRKTGRNEEDRYFEMSYLCVDILASVLVCL